MGSKTNEVTIVVIFLLSLDPPAPFPANHLLYGRDTDTMFLCLFWLTQVVTQYNKSNVDLRTSK